MIAKTLSKKLVHSLDKLKAMDIRAFDVREVSSITDIIIIASGRSSRQVKALADKVAETAKASGVTPLGIESDTRAEWILVDIGDVVVHVMQPTSREYYQLEKLWPVDVMSLH